MSNGEYATGGGTESAGPDKVDMSLDDIIRLNKKEQQLKRRQGTANRRGPMQKKGLFAQGKGVSPRTPGSFQKGGVFRGGASNKGRNKRVAPPAAVRRKAQGVITGLAARRPGVLLKRINRTQATQKTRQKQGPFVQRAEAQFRSPGVPRRTHRQADQIAPSPRRPFQLRRRLLPSLQQAQRDARQATFLFRRGIKVRAQLQKPNPRPAPVRTRPWRTSTTSNGILTVSINNPTARTQPEPPTAWTLHPPAAPAAPQTTEPVEKKAPKGVPLQFDINSVGKPQTSITLNERFRILKDQRATAAQGSKGSRFVTVG